MKNLINAGIITLGLGLIGTVSANPIIWDTNSRSSVCTSGIGNSCTFTKDGYTLKAHAYSTTNNSGSGVFEKATLTIWRSGLGVKNPDQSNESRSPHHALDDNGRDELVVFENNGAGYKFTGFEIGWRYRDSDMSAWVGSLASGYNFTGVKFSDLVGLGFSKVNFSNVPTNSQRSLGSLAGNYLILAPRADGNSEYVKISEVSGEITNNITEPNIIALFIITLMGAWVCRRRLAMNRKLNR